MMDSDISPSALRVLLAIVEHGGFTEAAKRLGLSQSGVSHTIRTLETALGGVLLERGRNGIAVTTLGERVIEHARHVLAHVEAIRQEASAAAGVTAGRLRVATIQSYGARVLPDVLRRFRRRHPRVDVVLLEGSDQEVHEWVRSRVVDLGFSSLPAKDLEAAAVTSDEVLLVARKGHRLTAHAEVRLKEVGEEPFLMSKGGCELMIRDLFARAGRTPNVTLEVRDIATLIAMIREGLGVSLIPELAIPRDAKGIAIARLKPRARRTVAALLPPGVPRSPVVTQALACALV